MSGLIIIVTLQITIQKFTRFSLMFELIIVTVFAVVFIITVCLTVDSLCRRGVVNGVSDKYVLITGCDSGFGEQTCLRLDALGCHVIAACLTPEGVTKLQLQASSRLTAVLMDVTKGESVAEVYRKVESLLHPDRGLWGIVNNAGVSGVVGPMEWLSHADVSSVLEVNLLGTVRVTHTFLPLLKRCRGSRIVSTSSILGVISIPYAAPYCMSKHGIEVLADALRTELHPYGVKVSLVEPGGHPTPFLDRIEGIVNSAWDRLPDNEKEAFGTDYLKQVTFLGAKLIPFLGSTSLDGVVDAYQHALFSTRPRSRYLVGRDAKLLQFLPYIPSFIIDAAFRLPGIRAVPRSCHSKS